MAKNATATETADAPADTVTPTVRDATVCGVKVQIDSPYSAGHTINDDEARTLNQTRRENIRNNVASKVKELIAGADVATLSADTIAAIQKVVSDYASQYTFASARVGGGSTSDPFEAACKLFARQHLNAALKAKGIEKDKYGEYRSPTGQTYDEKLAEIMTAPVIQDLARDRVAQRAKEKAGIAGLNNL